MGRQIMKARKQKVSSPFARHYQWSALPLSYSSTVGNSLTESIHAPQPKFGYSARTGKNRHHSACNGGEKLGNLFPRRFRWARPLACQGKSLGKRRTISVNTDAFGLLSFTTGSLTPWAAMGEFMERRRG